MTPPPQKESFLHEGKTHWICPMGFNCDQCSHLSGCQEVPPCATARPAPLPQWTDEEVMKEIQDAFDRGVEAAESTIDMQKHDTAIRNATLDEIEKLKVSTDMGDIIPWCDIEKFRKEQP